MRLSQDILAGLFFLAFGAGVIALASGYRLGTPTSMGPGFFPMVVGGMIAAFGLILMVGDLVRREGRVPVTDFSLRPLLVIVAVMAFGVVAQHFGLVPAIVALVVLARLAGREGSFLELVLMTAMLVAVTLAIFVYALGIPFRLWQF